VQIGGAVHPFIEGLIARDVVNESARAEREREGEGEGGRAGAEWIIFIPRVERLFKTISRATYREPLIVDGGGSCCAGFRVRLKSRSRIFRDR
jgi:hypothetical protein